MYKNEKDWFEQEIEFEWKAAVLEHDKSQIEQQLQKFCKGEKVNLPL